MKYRVKVQSIFLCLLIVLLVFLGIKYFFYPFTFAFVFTMALFIVIPKVVQLTQKKYNDLENSIEEKIILKENVNFFLNNDVRNGYLILTQNNLHLISKDKKPHISEYISVDQIHKVQLVNDIFLYVFISENEIIKIVSPENLTIVKKMKELNWKYIYIC